MAKNAENNWPIYQGTLDPHNGIEKLPPAPRWRRFTGNPLDVTLPPAPNPHYISSGQQEINLVNAALVLRRPLLVTGKPGSGKSSLAYAIAYELKLGPILYWPITSRTSLQEGLYTYDAVGRLQEAQLLQLEGKKQLADIGKYIRLGPLGTALLPYKKPRVLLIDEIDKSDIDLPNDLLHVFEEGKFHIPELARIETDDPIFVRSSDGTSVPIEKGDVVCKEFPLVILTSNGEKEFPPAFLRRCLRMEIPLPEKDRLISIIKSQLEIDPSQEHLDLLDLFIGYRENGRELATDQLLNSLHILNQDIDQQTMESLRDSLFRSLSDE